MLTISETPVLRGNVFQKQNFLHSSCVTWKHRVTYSKIKPCKDSSCTWMINWQLSTYSPVSCCSPIIVFLCLKTHIVNGCEKRPVLWRETKGNVWDRSQGSSHTGTESISDMLLSKQVELKSSYKITNDEVCHRYGQWSEQTFGFMNRSKGNHQLSSGCKKKKLNYVWNGWNAEGMCRYFHSRRWISNFPSASVSLSHCGLASQRGLLFWAGLMCHSLLQCSALTHDSEVEA